MGFIPAPYPDNEEQRLARLQSYRILDTPNEEPFDRITRLVVDVLNVPLSVISLIDLDRQWFKSRAGMPTFETPRYMAFCAHTILQNSLLIVPDARDDYRFSLNPLVTEWPGIRFYAGAPLISPDGFPLGALCAVDFVPRDLTLPQQRQMTDLAQIVMDEIALRYSHAAGVTGGVAVN